MRKRVSLSALFVLLYDPAEAGAPTKRGTMKDRSWGREDVLLALLFFVAASVVGAQDLSVSYIDGNARAQNGSAWATLSLGDRVSPQSTIQLSEGAYVELQRADVKLVLSQKGVYSLRDLVTSSRAMGLAGVGKAILSSLTYLIKGPVHNQSDVAGARGADKSSADDSEWETSNAQVYLDTGKDLLKTGQYELAINQLLQAVDEATDDELPQVHYYLAYAYSLTGDTHTALKYAADLEPRRADDWTPDYIILKAKLLVDTNAFTQEVAWLTQTGNDLSGDAQRAPIYAFLLGVGYRGMGDTVREKASLAKVVAQSAGSEMGTAAAQLLENP